MQKYLRGWAGSPPGMPKSARKLWHGQVTLKWISTYPGLIQWRNESWHNLEELWSFCKSQSNEMRAWCNLLTSFHQGNKSINEWYNAVQEQGNLVKYPPETAKILHQHIFWFFLHDEDFVSRTITERSIDLDNSLPVEWGSLWRSLRVSKPLHVISSKLLETCRQLKSI